MSYFIKWKGVPLLAAALLIGGQTAYAGDIDKALVGEQGLPLAQVTTVAGAGDLGDANGPAGEATFRAPWSLLVQGDDSVLIADARSQLIRKWTGADVQAFAGITLSRDAYNYPVGGLMDGQAGTAVFHQPKGLAADGKGNIYVADEKNHAIRKIDASGNVTTLAGSGVLGSEDGIGDKASFYSPQDIAAAADGTLYVADTLNHAIRKITPDGQVTTLTAPSNRVVEVSPGQVLAAGDYADGPMAQAKFNEPAGLAIDAGGNLYVSDSGNQLIRYINLESGLVSTVAGNTQAKYGQTELYIAGEYADGEASQARFHFPRGLAVDAHGGLVIADSLNHTIRYLRNGAVTTIAGESDGYGGSVDGVERSARMHYPTDVAVLRDGSLLVADAYNNKIRKIEFYELPAGITNDGAIKVVYGDKPIVFDAQPELSEGRTMVPVRLAAEALGFEVTFAENDDASVRTVKIAKGADAVQLTLGSSEVRKLGENGQDVVKPIDAAPYLKEERTYVPVRFFAEELGLDVQWDPDTHTVVLRDKLVR